MEFAAFMPKYLMHFPYASLYLKKKDFLIKVSERDYKINIPVITRSIHELRNSVRSCGSLTAQTNEKHLLVFNKLVLLQV
jgi:hypothetical protein